MTISKAQLEESYQAGLLRGRNEGAAMGKTESSRELNNRFSQMRFDLAKGLLSQAQALSANSEAIRAILSDFTR